VHYIGYIVLSIVALSQITNPATFTLVFLITCGYAIFQNREHINIVGLIAIIMLMKVIELPVSMGWLLTSASNYTLFGSYFLIDLPVILLVALRVPLSRFIDYKRFGDFDKHRYKITNADLVIGKTYMMYCLINLLALIENSLRHLDDFGFDGQSNVALWLYQNARILWDHYEYLKHILNMSEFFIILTTVSNYMRSPHFLKS
jgi:hypothetical protein